MTSQEHLQEMDGPASPGKANTEKATASVTRMKRETSGKIIWVCAPRPDNDPPLHLYYVVENDVRGGFPDIVFSSDVLTLE